MNLHAKIAKIAEIPLLKHVQENNEAAWQDSKPAKLSN